VTVRVRLTAPLAERAGGTERLEVPPGTLGEALHALAARHPGLGELLWRQGAVNPMLVLFRNEERLANDALEAPLAAGDELHVVTAVEGG